MVGLLGRLELVETCEPDDGDSFHAARCGPVRPCEIDR